jgi:hypothetical protein
MSSWTGALVRTVRHGGSETGSSAAAARLIDGAGGGGAGAGSGSLTLSRTERASWMADKAASVGSFIFFGVFAISVVASYYWTLRSTATAAGARFQPRRERV